ncbi:nuclear transport factor 2 family protein [Kitasatospora sp. NPDC096128]|uniref:nuclear transport factor 2 family protein n=1 Tax=Kitasatospora sp. NPDC096128 TaxID=3155547 RepID=UPI003320EFF0
MSIVVEEAPTGSRNTALWHRWIDLWNGDFAVADAIVAPKLLCHLPTFGRTTEPEGVDSPAALVRWIEDWHSNFLELTTTTSLGPFVNDGYIVGRRRFTGRWKGGEPDGADAPAGTGVDFVGIDILRIDADGLITEYWVGDNLIDMYCGLGAISEPVRARA